MRCCSPQLQLWSEIASSTSVTPRLYRFNSLLRSLLRIIRDMIQSMNSAGVRDSIVFNKLVATFEEVRHCRSRLFEGCMVMAAR